MPQTGRTHSAIGQTRLVPLGPDKPEWDAFRLAFAQKLKSARVAAGLSQEQLAKRCFLRRYDISEFERGVRTPYLHVLRILAHALGVSVGELTNDLAAPTRAAGMAQILSMIASQPGISTHALAEALTLPAEYVGQLLRCLKSHGEIVPHATGWSPASHRTPGAVEQHRLSELDLLTPTELKVLEHVGKNTPYAEIGRVLKMKPETARKHTANIRRKLKRSRQELIGIGIRRPPSRERQ